MEAEYVSMAAVAREMISLRSLLVELELPTADAVVFVDNSPAVFLASNSVVTQKSKHIDIRYHFVRDLCQRKLLQFVWIPSQEQVVDILTKYLQRELFQRFRACLVGCSA